MTAQKLLRQSKNHVAQPHEVSERKNSARRSANRSVQTQPTDAKAVPNEGKQMVRQRQNTEVCSTNNKTEPEASEATPTPTEEPTMPTIAAASAPPEASIEILKPVPAPRRGGRPPQKSRGRLGRNQYSRDAVSTANGASPANDAVNSPQSNGTNGTNNNNIHNGHESSDGATGHKTAKAKNSRLHKLSWNDIMRPAGAMQSYIAQRQVEMAGEKASPAPAVQPISNGEQHQAESKHEDTDLSTFKDLTTTQMMDHLSRDLVHWQKMITEQKEK